MRQERAVVTRDRLLRAAAGEFAANGYAGTSLQEVCRAAEVSMGALTFHFPVKSGLADAVAEAGASEVRALAESPGGRSGGGERSGGVGWSDGIERAGGVGWSDGVERAGGGALAAVAGLTCELARLLARSPMVRAAARLESEQVSDVGGWDAAWQPVVRELLQLAREQGELCPEVGVETVLQLTAHLLNGAAVTLRNCPEAEVTDCLEQIWAGVMRGLRVTAPAVG